MKKLRILVAGHDWGGLNLLAPLLRAWGADDSMSPEFLGAPVVRRDLAHLVPGISFAPSAEELSDWLAHRETDLDQYLAGLLAKNNYDVVVCATSAHALLERRLFIAARDAGVPSVAFCDMWWAYTERFHDGAEWTLPDRLWVIDEAMRGEAEKIQWPTQLPIDVIGSPLFADLVRRRMERGEGRGNSIRFISEPTSIKYPETRIDEYALADMLVSAVAVARPGMPIVIRPHPVDSAEAWRRWCFARRGQNVVFDTLPVDEAIADTAFAVGISSILLTEMRMCGVPAASIQPKEADYSYYCLPFEDIGIARIADADALSRWLQNPAKGDMPQSSLNHVKAIATATQLLRLVAAKNRESSIA